MERRPGEQQPTGKPPQPYVKLEPGVAGAQRLSSIRPAPDLTLGGVQKKKFAPAPPGARPVKKLDPAGPAPVEEAGPAPGTEERRRPPPRRTEQRDYSAPTFAPMAGAGMFERRDQAGLQMRGQMFGDMGRRAGEDRGGSIDMSDMMALIDPRYYYPTALPFEKPVPTPEVVHDVKRDVHIATMEGGEADVPRFLPQVQLGHEELLFVQLPPVLPIARAPPSDLAAKAGGKDAGKPEEAAGVEEDASTLKGAAEGWIGKIRVHQSGKMTLRIGNIDYVVNPGLEAGSHQHVLAVLPQSKQYSVLGDIAHRLVVTPDVSAMVGARPRPSHLDEMRL